MPDNDFDYRDIEYDDEEVVVGDAISGLYDEIFEPEYYSDIETERRFLYGY